MAYHWGCTFRLSCMDAALTAGAHPTGLELLPNHTPPRVPLTPLPHRRSTNGRAGTTAAPSHARRFLSGPLPKALELPDPSTRLHRPPPRIQRNWQKGSMSMVWALGGSGSPQVHLLRRCNRRVLTRGWNTIKQHSHPQAAPPLRAAGRRRTTWPEGNEKTRRDPAHLQRYRRRQWQPFAFSGTGRERSPARMQEPKPTQT